MLFPRAEVSSTTADDANFSIAQTSSQAYDLGRISVNVTFDTLPNDGNISILLQNKGAPGLQVSNSDFVTIDTVGANHTFTYVPLSTFTNWPNSGTGLASQIRLYLRLENTEAQDFTYTINWVSINTDDDSEEVAGTITADRMLAESATITFTNPEDASTTVVQIDESDDDRTTDTVANIITSNLAISGWTVTDFNNDIIFTRDSTGPVTDLWQASISSTSDLSLTTFTEDSEGADSDIRPRDGFAISGTNDEFLTVEDEVIGINNTLKIIATDSDSETSLIFIRDNDTATDFDRIEAEISNRFVLSPSSNLYSTSTYTDTDVSDIINIRYVYYGIDMPHNHVEIVYDATTANAAPNHPAGTMLLFSDSLTDSPSTKYLLGHYAATQTLYTAGVATQYRATYYFNEFDSDIRLNGIDGIDINNESELNAVLTPFISTTTIPNVFDHIRFFHVHQDHIGEVVTYVGQGRFELADPVDLIESDNIIDIIKSDAVLATDSENGTISHDLYRTIHSLPTSYPTLMQEVDNLHGTSNTLTFTNGVADFVGRIIASNSNNIINGNILRLAISGTDETLSLGDKFYITDSDAPSTYTDAKTIVRFDGTQHINQGADRQYKFIIESGKSAITSTTGYENIANSIPTILSDSDNWYVASEPFTHDGFVYRDSDGNVSIRRVSGGTSNIDSDSVVAIIHDAFTDSDSLDGTIGIRHFDNTVVIPDYLELLDDVNVHENTAYLLNTVDVNNTDPDHGFSAIQYYPNAAIVNFFYQTNSFRISNISNGDKIGFDSANDVTSPSLQMTVISMSSNAITGRITTGTPSTSITDNVYDHYYKFGSSDLANGDVLTWDSDSARWKGVTPSITSSIDSDNVRSIVKDTFNNDSEFYDIIGREHLDSELTAIFESDYFVSYNEEFKITADVAANTNIAIGSTPPLGVIVNYNGVGLIGADPDEEYTISGSNIQFINPVFESDYIHIYSIGSASAAGEANITIYATEGDGTVSIVDSDINNPLATAAYVERHAGLKVVNVEDLGNYEAPTDFIEATDNFLGEDNISSGRFITPAHSGTQFGELHLDYDLVHPVAAGDIPVQGDHIGGDRLSNTEDSDLDWTGVVYRRINYIDTTPRLYIRLTRDVGTIFGTSHYVSFAGDQVNIRVGYVTEEISPANGAVLSYDSENAEWKTVPIYATDGDGTVSALSNSDIDNDNPLATSAYVERQAGLKVVNVEDLGDYESPTGFNLATNNFLDSDNISTGVYTTPGHSGTEFGELFLYYQLSHTIADSDLPQQGDHIGGDRDSDTNTLNLAWTGVVYKAVNNPGTSPILYIRLTRDVGNIFGTQDYNPFNGNNEDVNFGYVGDSDITTLNNSVLMYESEDGEWQPRLITFGDIADEIALTQLPAINNHRVGDALIVNAGQDGWEYGRPPNALSNAHIYPSSGVFNFISGDSEATNSSITFEYVADVNDSDIEWSYSFNGGTLMTAISNGASGFSIGSDGKLTVQSYIMGSNDILLIYAQNGASGTSSSEQRFAVINRIDSLSLGGARSLAFEDLSNYEVPTSYDLAADEAGEFLNESEWDIVYRNHTSTHTAYGELALGYMNVPENSALRTALQALTVGTNIGGGRVGGSEPTWTGTIYRTYFFPTAGAGIDIYIRLTSPSPTQWGQSLFRTIADSDLDLQVGYVEEEISTPNGAVLEYNSSDSEWKPVLRNQLHIMPSGVALTSIFTVLQNDTVVVDNGADDYDVHLYIGAAESVFNIGDRITTGALLPANGYILLNG